MFLENVFIKFFAYSLTLDIRSRDCIFFMLNSTEIIQHLRVLKLDQYSSFMNNLNFIGELSMNKVL